MPPLKPFVPVFVGVAVLIVGQVAMTVLTAKDVIGIPSAPIGASSGTLPPQNTQGTVAGSWSTDPLCGPDLKVVFSCPIPETHRVVSVCGTHDLSAGSGGLQLRYGQPGALEVSHPPLTSPSARDAFLYGEYNRAGGSVLALEVGVEGVRYAVSFSYLDGNEVGALNISRGPTTLSCGSPVIAELRDLDGVVPSVPGRWYADFPLAPEEPAGEPEVVATVTPPPTPPPTPEARPEPRPSFDCAKAGTPVEKLLCSDAELADLDREMASIYREVRGSLAGPAKAALKDEQVAWIRERGRCSAKPDMAGCVRSLFVSRMSVLRARLPAGDAGDPLARVREGLSIDRGAVSTATCDTLWSARNWVYARHGYSFSTDKARRYFGSQSGYSRNAAVTSQTIAGYLTSVDKANRDLIMEAEESRGCR